MLAVSPEPVIVISRSTKSTPFSEPLIVAISVYVTGNAVALATHSIEISDAKTQRTNATRLGEAIAIAIGASVWNLVVQLRAKDSRPRPFTLPPSGENALAAHLVNAEMLLKRIGGAQTAAAISAPPSRKLGATSRPTDTSLV
jgi:hypothetical protein